MLFHMQQKITLFLEQLRIWQQKINLVSTKDVENLEERHVKDCLRLIDHIQDYKEKVVLDIGSGGGFPGIVLGIAGVRKIVMVESDRRKCEFLREVVRLTGLNGEVVNNRIEDLDKISCDIITSRACAPLSKLLEYVRPHKDFNNYLLFIKGRSVNDEIMEARKQWEFDYVAYEDGILRINKYDKKYSGSNS